MKKKQIGHYSSGYNAFLEVNKHICINCAFKPTCKKRRHSIVNKIKEHCEHFKMKGSKIDSMNEQLEQLKQSLNDEPFTIGK
jgi:hypothetical protein